MPETNHPRDERRHPQQTAHHYGDVVNNHCHLQGHVRGLLCNECSRGLGYFKDNIMSLNRAAKYLSGEDLSPEGGQ